MSTLHVLQHVPFEGPGTIRDWAWQRGYKVVTHALYEEALCPTPATDDIVCVMGGPMNIYEDHLYPWLAHERAWLKRIIAEGVPVMGICLGAQLLADALNAKVYPHHTKEIGWMPVWWSAEAKRLVSGLHESTVVLHWHGDTFDIPDGATPLAHSAYCQNQGFIHGRCLAFQFHLEAGERETALMLENCGQEIACPALSIHAAQAIAKDTTAFKTTAKEALWQWLDWWHKHG